MSPVVIFRDERTKESAVKRIMAIKPDAERPLAMWVGPYRKIRSLEQNSLYWRLVGMVANATGHDRHTLHQFFKRQAFGVRVERIGQTEIEITPSSARANKGEFSELIEYVQAFIAEHGIEESA